jgi:hypothetical protein
MRGRDIFLNSRSMDNLFLNRMIPPQADKTRGKDSEEKLHRFQPNKPES